MCWGAGQLLAAGVVRAVTGSVEGDLGWRLPLMLQWVWPVPLFIGAYLAPESPWNAVRRDKVELARKSLNRLRQDSPGKDREVEAALAYIRYTTALERAETESASVLECFRGTNLRRTEIVSLIPHRPLDCQKLIYVNRTALYGPHKFSVATPSCITLLSFSRLRASRNCKPSTSTFH